MAGPIFALKSRTSQKSDNPDRAVHLEDVATAKTIEENENPPTEPAMSITKSLIANPKIILLSMFANIGALMYGYDTMSLSLCLSMSAFGMQFGENTPSGHLIPAYWQSLWNAIPQLTTMVGAWSVGHISDAFGRRLGFFLSGLISSAGVAVLYIADTSPVFLVGKMINGIGLGMALATGQSYVSEIAPLQLRGILLSLYSFCMNLGLMMAASIAFSRLDIPTAASYQVLFAIGWTWAGLLLIFAYTIPESPYHLVRKGNNEKARHALARICNKRADISAKLADVVRVFEHEQLMSGEAKSSSLMDCFRGTNWRRTRIILYCNALSQMIGATFLANAPYFLVMAGMSANNTGMIVEIGLAFAISSSILTWFALGRYGRRNIILFGVALSCIFFLIMGITSCFPSNPKALWAIGISLELTWWTMGPTIGPAMGIAGEVSQVRLRAKSQSVGFAFNYFFSTLWNVVVPYMFNADEGNLGGKLGWIFLATGVISLLVVYFEFPETKDRSYEMLDEMFRQKVSSRRFATWSPSDTYSG
ncbi:general substrate transporter [Aspergillus cavernicola]|uniref:General substrate transporter n=1 Tax=Aspergillus cavernicola TaxID=176166 RepID=A0ABR4I7W6_9EURO